MYIEDILKVDNLQIEGRPSFTSTERINYTNNFDSLNFYIPKYAINDLENRYHTTLENILNDTGFYKDSNYLYFIQNWGTASFNYKQVDWSNTTQTYCSLYSSNMFIYNIKENRFEKTKIYSKCYKVTNNSIYAQVKQIQYVEYAEDYQWQEIIKVGEDNYQDLMYSNQTLNILGISAFLMIPVLLVLYLVKVFRKGIH